MQQEMSFLTPKPLSSFQIQKAMMSDPITSKAFAGVMSFENLPLHTDCTRPLIYVINTDIAKGPGKHWVTISLHNDRPCEFFDSLGKRPEHYSQKICYFLKTNGSEYIYTTKRIQGNATTCGFYCIAYAHCSSRGITLERFIDFFGENLQLNDVNVTNTIVR